MFGYKAITLGAAMALLGIVTGCESKSSQPQIVHSEIKVSAPVAVLTLKNPTRSEWLSEIELTDESGSGRTWKHSVQVPAMSTKEVQVPLDGLQFEPLIRARVHSTTGALSDPVELGK
jgi:hypothetical protein